jgi:hypothetical protein
MGNMNINVKGAVEIAVDYVKSLSDIFPATDLRLEEIMQNEKDNWLITVSFAVPGTYDERDYKVLEIDPKTKEVLAMRIRSMPSFDGGTS